MLGDWRFVVTDALWPGVLVAMETMLIKGKNNHRCKLNVTCVYNHNLEYFVNLNLYFLNGNQL